MWWAVGNNISNHDIDLAQTQLKDYGLENYKLRIFQGAQSDSLLLLANATIDSPLHQKTTSE